MANKSDRYATYKGKQYRLLYLGPTKYGRRAHLSFMDSSKDFWVPADTVMETTGQQSSSAPTGAGSRQTSSASRNRGRGRRTGCSCGSREGEVQDTDCRSCRFDECDD